MKRILRIILFSILVIFIFTQFKVVNLLANGKLNNDNRATLIGNEEILSSENNSDKNYYYIYDTVYRWNDQELKMNISDGLPEIISNPIDSLTIKDRLTESIELEWEILMDIEYKIRYYKDLDLEIYSPIFNEKLKSLDGKEVVIEGFVIPFDEEGDIISLSFNPYASCFFCGKASPASIISMQLKSKTSRYKIDDFKKFKGILYLNYDDPEEFYYVLKDAEEN